MTPLEHFHRLTSSPSLVHFYHLQGSSKAFTIAQLAKTRKKPMLVIAESLDRAEQLYNRLSFFFGKGVYVLPNWDSLPYDSLSPSLSIVSQRMHTLHQVLSGHAKIVIAPLTALMQKVAPKSEFQKRGLVLKIGDNFAVDNWSQEVQICGYVQTDVVEEIGEFCFQKESLDIFPAGASTPIRIDCSGGQIGWIRKVDTESQHTISGDLNQILILPVREVFLNAQTKANAIQTLKDSNSAKFTADQLKQHFAGMESFISWFYPDAVSPLHYFGEKWIFVIDEPKQLESKSKNFYEEVYSEYETEFRQNRFAVRPESLFLDHHQFLGQIYTHSQRIYCYNEVPKEDYELNAVTAPFVDHTQVISSGHQLQKTSTLLKSWQDQDAKIILFANTQTHAEQLKNTLSDTFLELDVKFWNPEESFIDLLNHPKMFHELFQEGIPIIIAPLENGFRLITNEGKTSLALVTETDIFGKKIRHRHTEGTKVQDLLGSLEDLSVGDHVIHLDYGIGRYEGLQTISTQVSNVECMEISYARGAKVFVPADKFHLIQKYVSSGEGTPSLNKLDDKKWKNTKSKAMKAVEDIADELVEIYAAREAQNGHPFSPDNALMAEFELAFSHEETQDQATVIQEIKKDMESKKPMDRLVCGDVGFGKTEIAMRAAFKAFIDKKQTCVLAPTTILAQQHFESFTERFKGFGAKIDVLSRFRTTKEQKEIVAKMADGDIDILIGTHRIFAKDVKVPYLGLLIVDEEQRFGVKHKENLKKMRASVDVLTMSATPIPRTLHMAISNARDLSVIQTPPADRIAIRTRVFETNNHIIQEAVEREIRRGGQVFIVHNRVETIFEYLNYLRSILPKVSFVIAHGQMGENELERVMLDFINGKYDVLLSTTIIESGLDIPRANTIIINNAQNFGLSQLYQLRGRVGRSNVQAYAYLLIPKDMVLTEIAEERLKTLREFSDLGVGFKIASRDLELRGSGHFLGSQQSGHIAGVGLELYTQMLESAIHKFKKTSAKTHTLQSDFNIPASLPMTYIANSGQRLSFYKKIASAQSEDQLWHMRESLEERFGLLPEEALNLFKTAHARILATQYGFKAIEHRNQTLRVKINSEKLNVDKLIKMLKSESFNLECESEDELIMQNIQPDMDKILEGLRVLGSLF